jgi:hypothetical protein
LNPHHAALNAHGILEFDASLGNFILRLSARENRTSKNIPQGKPRAPAGRRLSVDDRKLQRMVCDCFNRGLDVQAKRSPDLFPGYNDL